MRCHGVSLVATSWLGALIAGVSPIFAIAAGLPLMALAIRAYVAELRHRYGRRR